MTALYGYKWTSINGEEFDENSHVGQVWLSKTQALNNDDWFRAVDRCEKEVRDRTKTGEDSWPPSYEVFVTYAKESRGGAYKLFKPSLPEPKEDKEARKAASREKLRRIQSIIDE